MEFLSVGWLYAAPGFLGALVLLYFLKLKRREVAISSTYLWKDALDELRVNSPLQRLRMNLLLILQLLALLLLLLALARPVTSFEGADGVDRIILIDVSASMGTVDEEGGQTRLQRALDEARKLVEDLSIGDRAAIVVFNDEAKKLSGLTESKSALRRALDEVEQTHRPTRLANALKLVNELDEDDRSPTVYVLSDGVGGSLANVSLSEDVKLEYVRLGSETENVGIIGLDLVREAGAEDDLTLVANLGYSDGLREAPTKGLKLLDVAPDDPTLEPRTREVGVDLYIDGELNGSRMVEVSTRDGGTASFDLVAPPLGSIRRAEVRIDPGKGKAGDAFNTDDVAYAVITPRELTRVLLVTSEGNDYLLKSLSEDDLVAQSLSGSVPVMAVEDFQSAVAANDASLYAYDLIVLDRVKVDQLPPGNYLTFLYPPPFPELEDKGQAEEIEVVEWLETHPITRFVNFDTLALLTARTFTTPSGAEAVVSATHGPLVLECRDGPRRAIVCAFDLLSLPRDNPWIMDPSFAIFMFNAVRYLGPSGGDPSKDQLLRTGSIAELRFPPGIPKATVTPPGDEPEVFDLDILASDKTLLVPKIDRVGVYTVAFKDAEGEVLREARFAANLVNADEGAIAPVEELKIQNRTVKGEEEAEDTKRDVWKILALIALGILMLEWWIYNRRVFI